MDRGADGLLELGLEPCCRRRVEDDAVEQVDVGGELHPDVLHDQVALGDDAHERTVLDHGERAHIAFDHEPSRLLDAEAAFDRERIGGHDIQCRLVGHGSSLVGSPGAGSMRPPYGDYHLSAHLQHLGEGRRKPFGQISRGQ
jgi:hypothetical protein